MIEVKNNIRELITSIYECQKRMMINKRFLLEIENNGGSSLRLRSENNDLEKKIEDYKKKLSSLR
jgi:hypothetical protein